LKRRTAAASSAAFFYFIPVKGPGSVNRVNRKKFDSAKGSSHLHEFVDIGRRKVAAVPTHLEQWKIE